MQRRHWAALLASAGLHLLVLGWVRARELPRPHVIAAASPLQFEVLSLKPPPAPQPAATMLPAKQRTATLVGPSTKQPLQREGGSAAEGAQVAAGAEIPDDAPAREDGAVVVHSLLPPSVIPDPASIVRGRTVHPNPELDAAVARAREQARVEGRINAQLQEGFAEARALSGLADPRITAVGEALESALAKSDGGTPLQLGVADANAHLKLSYRRALEAYGKTGDPGFAPPGQAPTLTENLARIGAPLDARLAAQARESQLALAASATPLFSVTLDLEQAPNGEVVRVELLTRSGNARFDDFVLAAVPTALTRTPPPLVPLHATWEIEGWLKKDPSVLDAVGEYVAVVGPVLEQLTAADPANAHFEYRARLLRAWATPK